MLLLLICAGVVAVAAAALRRGGPDGKSCCWFIESDSIQCFFLSSFKLDLLLRYVPLCSTAVFTSSICLYDIGNYGHTRTQAGGSQPRRSPLCTYLYVCVLKSI